MIISSAGASGTTAAKGRTSSSSSSIVCVVLCAVLSCLVLYRSYGTRHLRGRERQTDKDSGRSKRATRWDLRALFVLAAFICMRQVGRLRPVECVSGAVLLVLHRKASGRTFSRTQTSCCTCCPEQPSVQPPHLQSSRWALTAASPSPHASATTRLAGFGCCSAVCLTSGHDPFWRNLCGHPSQVCSQCRTTSATCQSLSSHSVERIHGSERRGGLS
jgi:hypothetical protein